MKLSVIIVNYNVKYYIEQCITSVFQAFEYAGIDGDVWVVDNNSSDGSQEYLAQRFDNIHLICNKDNVGFSCANNQAIRQSEGEYVLLLNPDTIVGEDVFGEVIKFMDATPDASGVGVRMLRTDGSFAPESRRGIPTPFVSFCKMSGLGMLFSRSRVFGRYYMKYLDENAINEIEIMSGACMFMRRSVLDRTGLLDETFFMYGEDVDLSYRLLLDGGKNYYLPVSILHYKGESTKKFSFTYVNVFYKAMLIFFKKHYSHYSWIFTVPVMAAICLKGASGYLLMQCRRIFEKRRTELQYLCSLRYLFIASDTALAEMGIVAQKYHINHTDYVAKGDILTHGHSSSQLKKYDINPADFDIIVYDVDVFSYKDVLEFFRHDGSLKNRPNIATYSSRNKAIVTANYIFKAP